MHEARRVANTVTYSSAHLELAHDLRRPLPNLVLVRPDRVGVAPHLAAQLHDSGSKRQLVAGRAQIVCY